MMKCNKLRKRRDLAVPCSARVRRARRSSTRTAAGARTNVRRNHDVRVDIIGTEVIM